MAPRKKKQPEPSLDDIPDACRRERGSPPPPPQPETAPDDTIVEVEGLHFQRVYYTGMAICKPGSALRYEVGESNCPSFGQSSAFVLKPNQDGKRKKTSRIILFCPYTLKANQVTPDAGELIHHVDIKVERVVTKQEGGDRTDSKTVNVPVPFSEELLTRDRVDRLVGIMTRNWIMRCKTGLPIDIEVASSVLQRLGAPVPAERPTVRVDASTGEAKKHGKPSADALLKAVKPDTKRGKVLAYFMLGGKTIIEAMSEFGSTRSGVLTHLHGLIGDHGIGYELVSDVVTMLLPPDCEDPFTELGDPLGGLGNEAHGDNPASPDKSHERGGADRDKDGRGPRDGGHVRKPPNAAKGNHGPDNGNAGQTGKHVPGRGKGKPLAAEVTALPEKGKRREVAIATSKGFVELKAVAERIGASEGSVRSHLVDLHTKHGFGYEQDGSKVRLLAPKGWKP